MANHKSAIKRARQNERRQLENRSRKTRIKNVVKKVLAAIENGVPEIAAKSLDEAKSVIQKGAARGVIHKNAAARKISRLARRVNKTAD